MAEIHINVGVLALSRGYITLEAFAKGIEAYSRQNGVSVRDVWVAGRQVVAGGRPTGIDHEELGRLAAEHRGRVLAGAGITVPHPWPYVDAS